MKKKQREKERKWYKSCLNTGNVLLNSRFPMTSCHFQFVFSLPPFQHFSCEFQFSLNNFAFSTRFSCTQEINQHEANQRQRQKQQKQQQQQCVFCVIQFSST